MLFSIHCVFLRIALCCVFYAGYMQTHWVGWFLSSACETQEWFCGFELRFACYQTLTLLQLNVPLAQQFERSKDLSRAVASAETCVGKCFFFFLFRDGEPRGGRFVTRPSLPPSAVRPRPSHGALDASPEEGSLQATRRRRSSAWHADAYQPRGRGVPLTK